MQPEGRAGTVETRGLGSGDAVRSRTDRDPAMRTPGASQRGHPDEGRAGYAQQSRLPRANGCAKVVRSGLERALRKPDRSRYGGSRTLCREGRAPRQRRRVRTPRRFQLRHRLVDDPGELGEGSRSRPEPTLCPLLRRRGRRSNPRRRSPGLTRRIFRLTHFRYRSLRLEK